jgi:hypothetical protein
MEEADMVPAQKSQQRDGVHLLKDADIERSRYQLFHEISIDTISIIWWHKKQAFAQTFEQ